MGHNWGIVFIPWLFLGAVLLVRPAVTWPRWIWRCFKDKRLQWPHLRIRRATPGALSLSGLAACMSVFQLSFGVQQNGFFAGWHVAPLSLGDVAA
eukprot:6772800-Prymnesium_polylepis.1